MCTETNAANEAKVTVAGIARNAAVLSPIATAYGGPVSIKRSAANEAKVIVAVTGASAVEAASILVQIGVVDFDTQARQHRCKSARGEA